MLKFNWTGAKEYKILFPLFFSKFNLEQIYTKILLIEGEENYFFVFIENDILIYRIKGINIASAASSSFNYEFVFECKKKIDFISNDEDILDVIQENNSNNDNNDNFSENSNRNNDKILISTNLGNIFILNFNLKDFYYEIIFSFNIRHNFIREFKILFYTCNNILMTIDKHLFLFEITPNTTNINKSISKGKFKFSIIKNLLLRIEDFSEKIISAYLKSPKKYVVIFTNKFLYKIDFEADATNEIIFKKDPQFYKSFFSGFVRNDVVYYVKDSNSFSIYHIYDKENKFTIKLSAKNSLNELNFFKVINVSEDVITISNEKESELYFINKKFKLIHRENILFDKSFFLFNQKGQVGKGIYVFNLNLMNMTIKYKIGIEVNSINGAMLNSKSNLEENTNANFCLINCDLNTIESKFVDDKIHIEKIHFLIKTNLKKIKKILKQCFLSKNVEIFIFYKEKFVKKIRKNIELNLRLQANSEEKKEDYSNNNSDNSDNNSNGANLFFNKIIKFRLLLIKIFNYKFGDYSVRKSFNILFKLYFKNVYTEKLKQMLKIANNIKDLNVYHELLEISNKFDVN